MEATLPNLGNTPESWQHSRILNDLLFVISYFIYFIKFSYLFYLFILSIILFIYFIY